LSVAACLHRHQGAGDEGKGKGNPSSHGSARPRSGKVTKRELAKEEVVVDGWPHAGLARDRCPKLVDHHRFALEAPLDGADLHQSAQALGPEP